jgi:hypothetical protein
MLKSGAEAEHHKWRRKPGALQTNHRFPAATRIGLPKIFQLRDQTIARLRIRIRIRIRRRRRRRRRAAMVTPAIGKKYPFRKARPKPIKFSD